MTNPQRFLLKETVHLMNPLDVGSNTEMKSNFASMKIFEEKIIITYCIDTELKPESILKQRLMISEIVQGVIGEGLKNYDTELYIINETSMTLVGFAQARQSHLVGLPLLKSARECFDLVKIIIDSQLMYKSSLVDGLLAAISLANSGGLVDNRFAWAWRGFAYLIESLDDINKAPRKLDYQVTSSDGQPRKVRKMFKQKILKTTQEFEEYIVTNFDVEDSVASKFEQEMKLLHDKINNDILKVDFIEKFRNHIPTLNDFILDFIFQKSHWPSYTEICKQFHDWNLIEEDLIKPAKRARDEGFHEGGYSGILEGEKFDTYHGNKRFVAWVCMLLSIVLTNEPHIYDLECKEDQLRFDLCAPPSTELQINDLKIPDKGILEWYEYDNGEIVTKQVPVTHVVNKPEYVFEFLSKKKILLPQRTILIEMKRPKYLDYVFKGNGIVARGTLECNQDLYSLKIMKLYFESPNTSSYLSL